MITYIYGLIDPRDDQFRYVGKTVNLIARRREHFKEMQNRHGPKYGITARKRAWADELRALDLEPEFVVIEEVKGDWIEAEKRWIKALREAGHPLMNCFDGGQPGTGKKRQAEVKPFRWWCPVRGYYTPDSLPVNPKDPDGES